MNRIVHIGMLGSGFVADFYMDGLRDVPGTEVVANYSRSEERAREFGRKHDVPRQYTAMEELCADREVEMVVIGLPNHLHLPAVRGALLDMGCHTVEAARYFFGKEHRIKDVFAWGATLVHHDRTTGEDNAVLLLRLEDGRTSLTEASWTAKGGMELRNEVYGTMGRIITDTSSTRVKAFIQKSAGYLMEKADADVGWVFPIPDEARVYGYHEEMRHFVDSFVKGEQPREDFVDGYVVNSVLDAAYKSMQSGHWEAVHIDSKVTG